MVPDGLRNLGLSRFSESRKFPVSVAINNIVTYVACSFSAMTLKPTMSATKASMSLEESMPVFRGFV